MTPPLRTSLYTPCRKKALGAEIDSIKSGFDEISHPWMDTLNHWEPSSVLGGPGAVFSIGINPDPSRFLNRIDLFLQYFLGSDPDLDFPDGRIRIRLILDGGFRIHINSTRFATLEPRPENCAYFRTMNHFLDCFYRSCGYGSGILESSVFENVESGINIRIRVQNSCNIFRPFLTYVFYQS